MASYRWFAAIGWLMAGCVGQLPATVPAGGQPWRLAAWTDMWPMPQLNWADVGLPPMLPIWDGPFPITPLMLPVFAPPPPELPKGFVMPGTVFAPVLPPMYGGLGYGLTGYGAFGLDWGPYPLARQGGAARILGEEVKKAMEKKDKPDGAKKAAPGLPGVRPVR
jgi:hypothetical protein